MKKKIYLTICFIIGLQLNLNAQNITQSKVEINKILCKKWVPDYALMGGMRINQLPNNLAFELVNNIVYGSLEEEFLINNNAAGLPITTPIIQANLIRTKQTSLAVNGNVVKLSPFIFNVHFEGSILSTI